MFEGGVFSEQVPHGRALARVQVGEQAIEAVTEAGQRLSLDVAQCRLELGGQSGRMWFCHGPDCGLTIYSEDPGMHSALAALPTLREQVQALLQGAQRKRQRERRFWAVGLLVLVILVLGTYYGIGLAGRAALRAMPTTLDQRIGEMAMSSMNLGGPRVADPTLDAALAQIMNRLAPGAASAGFKFQVHVVKAPAVNAFALPGGNIVVFTGLLDAAEDPSEVAGVLAHEMAHVTLRHGLERIAHAVGVTSAIGLVFGDVSGLTAVAVEMMKAGTLTSYGRDQERAADIEGVRLLHRAGIDPEGLARFFSALEKKEGRASGVSWLSSHPELDERTRSVRTHKQALGRFEERPLDLDWAEVRRRAGDAR